MRVWAPLSAGGGVVTNRSMPQRNAASVLPDPVGARIRVWSPWAMTGQPSACAPVGAGKFASNQARTGGENGSRAEGAWSTRGAYRREPDKGCPVLVDQSGHGDRCEADAEQHARLDGLAKPSRRLVPFGVANPTPFDGEEITSR